MITAQVAQLVYDGAGMHELKNLATLQQNHQILSKTENRALAEYVMRKIDYANSFYNSTRFALGGEPMVASREVSRQINHIHHSCQKEIESKWQSPITDEEACKLMFQKEIENELADSAKNRTIKIDL